jgi:hypothetical protein
LAKRLSNELSRADTTVGVKEYIAALYARSDASYQITVMVRAVPETDGLLVAHLGRCGPWAHIPEAAIETVTDNGQIRCGFHTHAVADIKLKKPAANLELAYASLANLHVARIETLSASGVNDPCSCPDGQHYGKDSDGNWGCLKGL